MFSISESALSLVAKYADGSLRDADGILEQLAAYSGGYIDNKDVTSLLGTVDFDLLYDFSGIIHSGDIKSGLSFIDKILSANYNLKVFLAEFIDYLYDLYVFKNYENPGKLVNISSEYEARLKLEADSYQKEENPIHLN